HYYGAVSQMAVSWYVIDVVPTWYPWPGPRGHYAAISRPAEIVLLVGDSVWDNDLSTRLALGNTTVWASSPGSQCLDVRQDQGWTWYVHHPEQGRGGSRAAVESGRANAAMCDG